MMRNLILLTIFLSCQMSANAQARLVFNGAFINIENGAYVVIDNPNPNAVTRLSTGHFISEDENDRIRWNLGDNDGSYQMPFGRGISQYIPLTVQMVDAVGANGYFDFATYGRNDWENVNYLPSGITNFSGFYDTPTYPDNSRYTIDRFWLIGARGYTQNPDFQNMTFGYIDDEWNQADNVMDENRLWAQRYNPVLDSWFDYIPGNGIVTVNSTTNRVDLGAVPYDEVFDWWTLTDQISPLPVELLHFSAQVVNNEHVQLRWETANENNSDKFVVERSLDGINWEFVLTQKATGFSNRPITYTDIDYAPYKGMSYYRLKAYDLDGSFQYTKIIPVFLESGAENLSASMFPNPTTDIVFLKTKGETEGNFHLAVFDVQGRLMMNKKITAQDLKSAYPVSMNNFAQGTYFIQVQGEKMPVQAFKLVKL